MRLETEYIYPETKVISRN